MNKIQRHEKSEYKTHTVRQTDSQDAVLVLHIMQNHISVHQHQWKGKSFIRCHHSHKSLHRCNYSKWNKNRFAVGKEGWNLECAFYKDFFSNMLTLTHKVYYKEAKKSVRAWGIGCNLKSAARDFVINLQWLEWLEASPTMEFNIRDKISMQWQHHSLQHKSFVNCSSIYSPYHHCLSELNERSANDEMENLNCYDSLVATCHYGELTFLWSARLCSIIQWSHGHFAHVWVRWS